MKQLLFLLFATLSLAQAQSLTLNTALGKANSQAPVASAQSELGDAKANQQRVLADPLLTRPSKVQAEQRVVLAQANYDRAVAQAQYNIVAAFTQVLEAEIQNRLTDKALDLANRNVEVAQIRQRNGSGTQLDVRQAINRRDDARTNAARADSGLTLARSSLRSLVGPFETLVNPSNPPTMPEANIVKDLLSKTPDVVQIRQRVELANLQVELLDPSYAAKADIDAAKARAEQAAQGGKELERAFSLQYDNLYQNLVAANRALAVQEAALANAKDVLANDKKRLDAGLISALAYTQSELSAVQAEYAQQQAEGNYLRAYYSLLAGGVAR